MYIFSKGCAEISAFKCDVSSVLQSIDRVELLSVYPTTQVPLNVSQYGILDCLTFKAEGGQQGIAYNVRFQLINKEERKTVSCVVVVSDEDFTPINNSAPDSFMDLVGVMRAGESTVSTVVFNLNAGTEVNQGYVTWELLNNEAEILSSGNAFSYEYVNNGMANIVTAQCVIVCPSYLEPTSQEKRYQLRYTLHLKEDYYQYETLSIQSTATVPIGSSDMVEMHGNKSKLSIVLPELFDDVRVCIYYNNAKITSEKVMKDPIRISTGWLYTACLDTSQFAVDLESYDVVYSFKNCDCETNTETAKLWIINPSIKSAADDVLALVNKARTTLYGAPDLLYTMPVLMTWLRRGRDVFNGWQGLFTSITMTNAKGVFREYWILCSELGALESQYLAEGEKAFDFSGAAISLNVDRTGFLDSMIGAIRSNLDQNLKPIKQNLIQKGYTAGDGSGTDGNGGVGASIRAIGAVGLSITPASAWGRFYPGYVIGRAWL